MAIAIWTMKLEHLDRLEQHPVEVGGGAVVVAVLDRPVQLDPPAAEDERR